MSTGFSPKEQERIAEIRARMKAWRKPDPYEGDTEQLESLYYHLRRHAPDDLAFLLALLGVGPDQEQTR